MKLIASIAFIRSIAPVALVTLLIAAAPLLARQTFRSAAEVVRLDVFVTDGRKPIAGLTAKDFEVRDLGAAQTIRVEPARGGDIDVILTLDVSDSLSPERLAALKAAARQVIELLAPNDRVEIITFNHLVTMRSPLDSTRAASLAALDDLGPAGGTALYDAVFAGLMSVPAPVSAAAAERRTLQIVLSDGDDSASWLNDAQVRAALRRSSVVVYSLAPALPPRIGMSLPEIFAPGVGKKPMPSLNFSSPVIQGALDKGFMRDAARDTGGRGLYVDVARPDGTAAAFRQTFEEFRQRYVITYTSTREDKGWHPVGVTVGRRGAVIFARSGYFRD